MFGFSAKEMGIDLGTANTLIYIKDKGMVLNEASCIAYDKRNAEVIATGAKAKAMYGKAPKDIVVVKPLQLQRDVVRSKGFEPPWFLTRT